MIFSAAMVILLLMIDPSVVTEGVRTNLHEKDVAENTIRWGILIAVLFLAVQFCASVLLLVGIVKRKRFLATIWIVVSSIVLVLDVVAIVVAIILVAKKLDTTSALSLTLVLTRTILQAYFHVIIINYKASVGLRARLNINGRFDVTDESLQLAMTPSIGECKSML